MDAVSLTIYQKIEIHGDELVLTPIDTIIQDPVSITKTDIVQVGLWRELDELLDPFLEGSDTAEHWYITTTHAAHSFIGTQVITADFLRDQLGPYLGVDTGGIMKELNSSNLGHWTLYVK